MCVEERGDLARMTCMNIHMNIITAKTDEQHTNNANDRASNTTHVLQTNFCIHGLVGRRHFECEFLVQVDLCEKWKYNKYIKHQTRNVNQLINRVTRRSQTLTHSTTTHSAAFIDRFLVDSIYATGRTHRAFIVHWRRRNNWGKFSFIRV